MEIFSKDLFNIFETNFNYPIIETPVGRAIKMPANDAFIYCLLTGSGYLDNPVYPFTPKGLTKLFYSAFDYKFVTGIFDNVRLNYTPISLRAAKPFLFEGFKYIVPVEFTKDIELLKTLEEFGSKLDNPQDYIIQRIECRKKGNGMEPFLEYLTSEYFKTLGYAVETQIPLAHSSGSPDFGGYIISSFINDIRKLTNINGGFHLIELSMLRFPKSIEASDKNFSEIQNSIIVGEAKTSTSVMDGQLEKYLSFNVFDAGYEITTLKENASSSRFGLVTVDKKTYKLRVTHPTTDILNAQTSNQKEYIEWLINYFKFYLIANFTNDEFDKYFQDKNSKPISSQKDIAGFINSLTVDEIIMRIRSIDDGPF